jgi:hypothetical protein
LRSLAASAAFVAGFCAYIWLTDDAAPSAAVARADARQGLAADIGAAVAELSFSKVGAELASLESFDVRWQDMPSEPGFAAASLSEGSFDDRFGDVLALRGAARPASSTTRKAVARLPVPRPARAGTARTKTAQAAPKRTPKAGSQLASASTSPVLLGYAADDAATDSGILKGLTPKDADPFAEVDPGHTAIYDIRSHAVYLPNGRRLEAHSGLGRHMDDPRSVTIRNVGVTPPNVYDLKMREARFHGVRAIRLIPRDHTKMHGRSGMLAHTYMLGPSGESNGCVSFKDYPAFLDAYERGDVTTLVVVEHLAGAPSAKTAADWFSTKLKEIFQRS